MIQILSLEYQTLRSEIMTITTGRFQFLGLMTAAAAILASGLSGTISTSYRWLLVSLVIVIIIGGVAYFWILGGIVVKLSRRIAIIEGKINELASHPQLLSWESEHQNRSWWNRLTLGQLAITPKRRSLKN